MGVSVCFPYIICFDGHQENSEHIQTHYRNYLPFIWNFLAQFEAPELQEQLFDRFWPLLVDYLRLGHHVRRTTMARSSTAELRAIVVMPEAGQTKYSFQGVSSSKQLQKMRKFQDNSENIEASWDNFYDTRRVALYGKTRSYTHSGAGNFSNTAVSI